MDEIGSRRGLTRRGLLAAALSGGASSDWPACADEPAKVSQADAQYQNVPKGMFGCAVCTFFVRPRSCKVVSGDISPTGWCKLFDLPD
ncbi:MAG TPA: hypothetical protein VFC56_06240 [Stellaceae bacterium]|nr:hypothetical protein [Stellaceae bacterium]